jgi:hybrid cluster-associated redox disulfide protein
MLNLTTSVEEALALYPQLARSFVSHHMICVGCDIARFHTIQEAAQMYDLDPAQLLSELQSLVDASNSSHVTDSSSMHE